MNVSPIQAIAPKITQLLDYADTHPNRQHVYVALQMHLWAHSDALYLRKSKSRSRAGVYAFLSNKSNLPIDLDDLPPLPNAPINVLSKLINAPILLAQESKTVGYTNVNNIVPI